MTQLVVIDKLLSRTRRGCIFNASTLDGNKHRFVAESAVLPRSPVNGETWSISGLLRVHPKHGPQVTVTAARLERPSGRLIVDLLCGPIFHDIGPQTAHALWDRYGQRLYEILDAGDEPAIIEALGDTKRACAQARTLIESWKLVSVEPTTLRWLDTHGFPPHLARKLIGCYGQDVIARLEENPYRLLAFTGWRAVDDAARSMGLGPDDPRRLIAAVEAALYQRLDALHTWTDTEELRRRVTHLLGNEELVCQAIDLASSDFAIVALDGGWQALGPHTMERQVVERCQAILSGADARESQPGLFRARPTTNIVWTALDAFQRDSGINLNRGQREAVLMALTCPLGLLMGSAGVGKTTVLKAITFIAVSFGWTVHQMALSGRAALRMAESTGHSSRTIAGWLQRVESGEIVLDDEPLIVIDECSMVDLPNLYRILRAAPPGCRFLLVGDPAQLPPIGFGLTLHALVEMPDIPAVTLAEVMRQSAESGIPGVAADIRAGRQPSLAVFDPSSGFGVSFVDAPQERIVDAVLDIVAQLGGYERCQVVGSIKGRTDKDGGIRAINAEFHRIVSTTGQPQLFDRFCPGEPVIWTVNDYDLGLFNGSLGTVVEATSTEGGPALAVEFDDGRRIIPEYRLEDLELAYAITCHKSQGSAFERVIVPVVRSRILDRTLLYTAVTRARKQVVLVGDRAALLEAIAAPPSSSRRQTGLALMRVDPEGGNAGMSKAAAMRPCLFHGNGLNG